MTVRSHPPAGPAAIRAWRPRPWRRMVREDAAEALVADAALALAARGHQPVITAGNSVRLVRLGALMLAEFGISRETEDDG